LLQGGDEPSPSSRSRQCSRRASRPALRCRRGRGTRSPSLRNRRRSGRTSTFRSPPNPSRPAPPPRPSRRLGLHVLLRRQGSRRAEVAALKRWSGLLPWVPSK